MRCNLFCPGPSVLRVTPKQADLTIAVNRAALVVKADWWAALDYPMVRDHRGQVLGKPLLLSRQQQIERFGPGQAVEQVACPVAGWERLTACAALVFAASLGATTIEVFGADWSNEPDFDGVAYLDTTRDDKRWAQEKQTWNAIRDWLLTRGVRVYRWRNGLD